MGLFAVSLSLQESLEYIAVLSGILCVWLQTREDIRAWPLGILSVSIYVWIFYQARLYSDALLHFIYIVLNAYGWWYWSQRRRDTHSEVPIRRFKPWLWVAVLAGVLVVSALWGHFMALNTQASFPYADAYTTVMSLTAQYFLAKKYLENWLLWISVNLVAIPVYVLKQLYPTAGLFAIYLALCILGWLEWSRQYRMQRTQRGIRAST